MEEAGLFKARDGAYFDTEYECLLHEAEVSNLALLEEFLLPRALNSKDLALVQKSIKAWEAHKTFHLRKDVPVSALLGPTRRVRTTNCLRSVGINFLSELVLCTESQLLRVPNLGVNGIAEIVQALAAKGLRLAPNEDTRHLSKRLIEEQSPVCSKVGELDPRTVDIMVQQVAQLRSTLANMESTLRKMQTQVG